MLLALLLFAQNADPVRIEASWDGKSCTVRVDGAPVPAEGLDQPAREWSRHGRPVRVTASADTPYRCIGGTVFALQGAGYGTYVPTANAPDFDATFEATVRFFVPAGKCAPSINGIPVSAEQIEALGKDWRRYQPQIHLQPDPKVDYACFDRMLQVLKRTGVQKMGFIGNEQYQPDRP